MVVPLKFVLRNEPEKFNPPARARVASLRLRRAAKNQRTDQTQHERESIFAVAKSFGSNQESDGRTATAISKPDGTGIAGKAGETARLPRRQHHRWQRLG